MNKSVRHLDRSMIAVSARAAGFLAPAVVTAGAVAATKRFATFERALQRLVITGEATDDQIGLIGQRIEEVADVAALPIENVKQGFASLLEAGKTVGEALKLLESTSIAAQASDAQAADLATTIIAVGDNLGIAADRAQIAYDIMIKGGKLGKFELKDMAQHLPGLIPQFANLGLKGEEGLRRLVAMMQTVRLQTGDAGQAATALGDLFQKMEVDTVQKKFAKFGIDVRASLARARREGRELTSVFLDLAQEATKGDLSKLPQLIPDKEMRRAVNALLQERGRLKGFENDLGSAAGETIRDLSRLTDDAQAKFDRLGNAWDKLVRRVGGLSATVLIPAIENLNIALDENTWIRSDDGKAIDTAAATAAKNKADRVAPQKKINLSSEQIKQARSEHETLTKKVSDITKRGASSELEHIDLMVMKDRLGKLQVLIDDLNVPIIQAAQSRFPDDLSQKLNVPRPRPTGADRMLIGVPRIKPVVQPNEIILERKSSSVSPRLPMDMPSLGSGPSGSRLPSPFLGGPMQPPANFKALGGEAKKTFDDIERAADMDLSGAGDKAMTTFATGFSQQSEAVRQEARQLRKDVENIMTPPIKMNVSINGPRANVGRSMPHIDANGDG